MRLIRLMAMIVAALLLGACAQEPAWHKQDGSAAAFEKDTATCFRGASIQAQAQLADQVAPPPPPQMELRLSQGRVEDTMRAPRKAASQQENALRSKLYSQCMQRLGYRPTKP